MMHILTAVLTMGNIDIDDNDDSEAVLDAANQALQVVAVSIYTGIYIH